MANSLTVFLSGDPTDTQNVQGPFKLKGETDVIFNFDSVEEGTFSSIKLVGDFGDDSKTQREYDIIRTYSTTDETLEIADTGKISNVLRDIKHTYNPRTEAYFTNLTATFDVTFSNLQTVKFYTKFEIAQDSFHSAVDKLHLVDTQFLPTSTNELVAVFHNERGDVINEVLKPVVTVSTTTIPITSEVPVSPYPFDGVPTSLSATHWWSATYPSQLLQSDGASATNTDPISAWIDLITGTYNMTQPGAGQPEFRTDVRNSSAAVFFNGINDTVRVKDSYISYTQPYSVLVVMHDLTATKPGATTPYFDQADNIIGTRVTGRRVSSDQYNLHAGTNFNVPVSTTAPTANDPHIFIYIVSGGSSEIRIDGVSAAGDAGIRSFRPMRIGADYLETQWLSGFVFEVVFWDRALTLGEITTLNNYYSSAYKIGLSAQPTPESHETESFPLSGVPSSLSATYWWNAQRLGINDIKSNGAVVTDGGPVTMWRDRITGTYNLTDPVATTNQRPLWRDNIRNGQGAVHIDNDVDLLTRGASGTQAYSQPYTIVITFQDLSGDSDGLLFNTSSAAIVSLDKSGGSYRLFAGSTVTVPTSTAPVNTDPHIAIFEVNGSASKLYFDSVTAVSDASVGSNAIVPISIGSGVSSMSAYVYDVQFYDKVLTETELNTIHAELSSTFKINLSAQPEEPPPPPSEFPLSGVPTDLSATHWYSALYQANLLQNDGTAIIDQEEVGQWYDRITGTYNLTQSAAASQPFWDSTARNNQGGVVFDGVDDNLTIPTSGVTQYSQPFTVVITFQDLSSLDTNYATIFSTASSGGVGSVEFYKQGGEYYLNAGSTLKLPISTAPVNTDPHIAIFEVNGSSTKVYFDSVTAVTGISPGTNAFDFIQLGNNVSETSAFSGTFFDVQFYNEILPASALNSIHNYLSGTWLINLSAQPTPPPPAPPESFPLSGVPATLSATYWWTARYASSDIRQVDGTNAASGEEVAMWRDRITGTYNLFNEVDSPKPKWNEDVRNEQGAMFFDAISSTFTRAASGEQDYTQPYTVVITFQDISGSSTGTIFESSSAGSTVSFSKTNGGYQVNAGTTITVPTSTAPVNTAPHIAIIEFNGSSSKVYFDSVTAIQGGNFGSNNITPININSSTTPFSGFVYDVQFYDNILSVNDLYSIHNDLSGTYLINLSAQPEEPIPPAPPTPLSGTPPSGVNFVSRWWVAEHMSYDSTSAIAADGEAVTNWVDKVSGVNTSVPGAVSAPTALYNIDALSGRRAIKFDADAALFEALGEISAPMSFSLVFFDNASAGGTGPYYVFDGRSGSSNRVSFFRNTTNRWAMNAGGSNVGSPYLSGDNTEPHVIIGTINGEDSVLWIDRQFVVSGEDPGSNSFTFINIGSDQNFTASSFLSGYIADLAIYNGVLTLDDIYGLFEFYANEYKLSYETAAPGITSWPAYWAPSAMQDDVDFWWHAEHEALNSSSQLLTSNTSPGAAGVDVWNAKYGGVNLTDNAQTSRRPGMDTGMSVICGRNALRFQDTHELVGSMATDPGGSTIACVVIDNPAAGNVNYIFDSNNFSNRQAVFRTAQGKWAAYAGSAVWDISSYEVPAPNTEPHILIAYINNADSQLWIDGSPTLTGSVAIGTQNLSSLTVGNQVSFGGLSGLSGNIADIAVFSGSILSEGKRRRLENFYSREYGIALDGLPVPPPEPSDPYNVAPSGIDSAIRWWTAGINTFDSGSAVADDKDQVYYWNDRIAYHRLDDIPGELRPYYKASQPALCGRPVVEFKGAEAMEDLGGDIINQPFSFAIVWYSEPGSNDQTYIFSAENAAAASNQYYFARELGGVFWGPMGSASSYPVRSYAQSAVYIEQPGVANVAICTISGTNTQLWMNGKILLSGYSPGTNSLELITLGTNQTYSSSRFLSGYIADISFYNDYLSVSSIIGLFNFFKDEYGFSYDTSSYEVTGLPAMMSPSATPLQLGKNRSNWYRPEYGLYDSVGTPVTGDATPGSTGIQTWLEAYLSRSAYDLTAGSTSHRIGRVASFAPFNGHPAMRCEKLAKMRNLSVSLNPLRVFGVVWEDPADLEDNVIFSSDNSLVTVNLYREETTASIPFSGRWIIIGDEFTTSNTVVTGYDPSGYNPPKGEPTIFTAYWDPNGYHQVWINGVASVSGDGGAGNALCSRISLGNSYSYSTSRGLSGYVGDIFATDTQYTNEDRIRIERWFSHKYGISITEES